MNAIGYIRSAVKDQTGETMEKQVEEIATYCKNNGLQLLQIFKDDGASGSAFNRKGWKELKDYLHDNKGGIQSLIVPGLDRIGRDLIKTPEEIAFIEREYEINICTVKGQVTLGELEQLFKPAETVQLRRSGNRKPKR